MLDWPTLLNRIKRELSSWDGCYYVSLNEFDLYFRPEVPWGLREEYFRIWLWRNTVIVGFVDEESPFLDVQIFAERFNQIYVTRTGACYWISEENLALCVEMIKEQYNFMLAKIRTLNGADKTYITRKWLDRPQDVYLIEKMLERFNISYVMRLAQLLSVSALVLSLAARRELVK